MTKIFLVDDEPLVLIGMQGMLNWAELGYTVVGTARNGAEALKAIGETYPDIVVSDIRMPVRDGFTLAESCHKDGSALPVFIMLTSYEEFDYVKRSMRLGVVDYLVKIDLTAESLTAALDKARAAVEKERRQQAPAALAVSMDSSRDRLFLQLYGGLLTDREARVLDEQGAVIPGLYCVGNNSASVMGPAYPGAGSTLGPAMTFAFRAVADILGKPLPLENTQLLKQAA